MKNMNIFFFFLILIIIAGNISGILDASEYGKNIDYYTAIVHILKRIFPVLICWGIAALIVILYRKYKNKKRLSK